MRVTRVGYALGIAAAVAVFAGCSSNGSSSSLGSIAQTPGGTQSIVRNHPAIALPSSVINQLHLGNIASHGQNWQGVKPNATTTYIVGCQFFGVNCNMYIKGKNIVVGTIAASYPNGICVDKAGNVWIPDGGATTISRYPHGSTTANLTLSGDGNQPSWCAVGNNGAVYVGDIVADVVQVYAPGATSPTRFLKVKSAFSGGSPAGYVIGVAVDETPVRNTLAVSWINFATGAAGVDEFPGAKQKGEHTVFTNTDFLGGVTFDSSENIVLNDQTAGTVDVGPTTCAFGYVSGDAVESAIDHGNKLDYVGDAVNNVVDAITYSPTCTGAGVLKKTYSHFAASSSVIGTAVSPGTTN